MRRITKALRTLELSFDLIVSSPFIRARETAEIVAAALALEANGNLGTVDSKAVCRQVRKQGGDLICFAGIDFSAPCDVDAQCPLGASCMVNDFCSVPCFA